MNNPDLQHQLLHLLQLLEQMIDSKNNQCKCGCSCGCPTDDVLEQTAFRFNEQASAAAANALTQAQERANAQFAQLLDITRQVTDRS